MLFMQWTLLTNHARVLIAIARLPDCRVRELAEAVGLTERATHRIVQELADAGYLTKHRVGNRTFYELHADRPLREDDVPRGDGQATVGELLRPVLRRAA
jgi:DNA-binding transcriptional ArsR family regulator